MAVHWAHQHSSCVPGGPEEVVNSGCESPSFMWIQGGRQASVGKGRAPESGFLEGPVLWLRYEYTWYQTCTRADTDCQESMVSHQPLAEMLETAVCYLESLCFLKSGSKKTKSQGLCMTKCKNNLLATMLNSCKEPFPLSLSSTSWYAIQKSNMKCTDITDAQR